jgi:hypothetical protein
MSAADPEISKWGRVVEGSKNEWSLGIKTEK